MQLERSRPTAVEQAHPHWKADDHLISVLAANAARYPHQVAMRERDHGIWQEYDWQRYFETVLAFAAGLEARGVRAGDIVMVIGDNRPNLYFAMLGAICLRAVPSPAYADTPPDELRGQLTREGIRIAIAEDQEQVDKLMEGAAPCEGVELIVYDDPRGLAGKAPAGVVSFDDIVAAGLARLADEPGLKDDLATRPSSHDTAILLHSSGTTGIPKAVPLKHGHLLAAVRNAAAAGYFREGEVHMAHLPLAWVGDFTFSVAAALDLRFAVNIPESHETARRDFREMAPTLFFASPRAWQSMLTRIQIGMAESTSFKRWLYDRFMPFAVELERRRLSGRAPSLFERLRYRLGDLLVYGPIRDQLGVSRVERPYTAGEAIGEDVFLFFRALGLNLRQFYGQTENAALAVAQAPDDISLSTVGRPFPGVEVRIDDAGEILIRGDNVFDGYHQDPRSTSETLKDGWLHTGDAGLFDDSGGLVVLGRLSEQVRTETGTRYIPIYVENRLKFSQFIKDVCVIGRDRPFLTAIVCIEGAAVGQWAQDNGIPYTSYADLSQNHAVGALIEQTVAQVNERLPQGLQVRRFVNLHKEFDPDDGEVTRTRKLRRELIDERYGPIIEALYSGDGEIEFEAPITYETGQAGTITRRLVIREVTGGK